MTGLQNFIPLSLNYTIRRAKRFYFCSDARQQKSIPFFCRRFHLKLKSGPSPKHHWRLTAREQRIFWVPLRSFYYTVPSCRFSVSAVFFGACVVCVERNMLMQRKSSSVDVYYTFCQKFIKNIVFLLKHSFLQKSECFSTSCHGYRT